METVGGEFLLCISSAFSLGGVPVSLEFSGVVSLKKNLCSCSIWSLLLIPVSSFIHHHCSLDPAKIKRKTGHVLEGLRILVLLDFVG